MSEEAASGRATTQSGGCLCGAIRYELDAPIEVLINCHCRFCRRAHGAAFATSSPVPTGSLRIVEGEAELTRWEGRFFCRKCATRLFNRGSSLQAITALMVSSLDREPTLEPAMHLNLESKSPWYRILDEAPRFDAFPPGVSEMLSESD